MDCSTQSLPVHKQLPEFTQTDVHQVGDAIQPSHPLSSPSPPIFNLSQHQGLFKGVSSSHQVAKVLEFQLQHSGLRKGKYGKPFNIPFTHSLIPVCTEWLWVEWVLKGRMATRLIHFSQALRANKKLRALIHSLLLDRHDTVSVQTAENEIEVE